MLLRWVFRDLLNNGLNDKSFESLILSPLSNNSNRFSLRTYDCLAIGYWLNNDIIYGFQFVRCDWTLVNMWLIAFIIDRVFFKNITSGKSTTLPWQTTHPRVFGHHRLFLIGFYQRNNKLHGWEGVINGMKKYILWNSLRKNDTKS